MWLDPAADGPLTHGQLTLSECYELCRGIERAHSKTYYFATSLFPAEVRSKVHALYAFMRYADELVDNPGATTLGEQHASLGYFEAQTLAAMDGEPSPNPVLRAFGDTACTCGIEANLVEAFMKSMKMDTYTFRYQTYADLEEYVYGSAAVVGLMMCRILGATSEEARPYAEALGVAMQLSNFLRDVREDWERGRVYIPLEDMERFGYQETDLAIGTVDERFVGLMRFEIDRARRLYALADEGMSYIPRGRRYPVEVAHGLYASILDSIEDQHYDIFSRRAETSLALKLGVAVRRAAADPAELLARWRG